MATEEIYITVTVPVKYKIETYSGYNENLPPGYQEDDIDVFVDDSRDIEAEVDLGYKKIPFTLTEEQLVIIKNCI